MVTLTIELDDALYARIREMAERAGTRPEQVVEQQLADALGDGVSPEFRAQVSAYLGRHERLMQRLAE
ncbi:MAG: hypothetical protein IT303_13360 [Dehalococcoidia bacterium]|nr:hypothetical protein [Dehalococcoidia bacterium]